MSLIQNLVPWEYKLPAGFTVRGYHSQPSGKPVIHFIHSNGFCGLTFEVLLEKFQNEYDFFISDALGHGESDAFMDYPDWNKNALNFEKVWQHFMPMWGSVPKIAMGHSYGAVISTLLIAKDPSLFDMGILLDPVYAPPRLANAMSVMSTTGLMKKTALAKQAQVRTVKWPSEQAAWDYFYQRGIFKGWQDDCLQSYLKHGLSKHDDGSMHLKCPARIESAIFATYVTGLWRAIKAVNKPVALFYGDKTYPFISKAILKIRKTNPHYDFIEMPGGHCFMQENPVLTAQGVKQKLRVLLS